MYMYMNIYINLYDLRVSQKIGHNTNSWQFNRRNDGKPLDFKAFAWNSQTNLLILDGFWDWLLFPTYQKKKQS